MLVTSSCGNEDDDGGGETTDTITEADLVGSWAVSEFESSYSVSGTFLGEPVDNSGTSSISGSALQLELSDDGSWTSSGDFTSTVVSEDGTDVTQQNGIGQGSWSFRSDTLFIEGMENYSSNGVFSADQPYAITDFVRDLNIELETQLDNMDTDSVFSTTLRTRGDWRILLER